MRNVRHQWVIRVGVRKHRADRKEDFRDSQSRGPLISQNVQTNGSIGVDVGMVDLGREANLGRFEGIVGGEQDG